MCYYPRVSINCEYIRDHMRGRISDPVRFTRIEEYAHARWKKCRDLQCADQWCKVMAAVKRRRPF